MAKLVRPQNNKMIAGVLSGIAQRFGWDTTLVRIIFVLLSFFSVAFPGLVVYLVLWLLIPKAESNTDYIEHR